MDSITEPVISALDTVAFTPPRSPRTYRLAPLSYRERSRMQRAMRVQGGDPPDRTVMLGVLRQCLAQMDLANLAEVMAQVDEAEAAPDDKAAQARLAVLERAARHVPAYAELLDAQMRYREEQPLVTVSYALRGWAGPGLPTFRREDGRVPDDLLEAIPAAELDAVAGHALVLIWLGPSAEKNSEAPSPSLAILHPTSEG
jgi:hypothetical protein